MIPYDKLADALAQWRADRAYGAPPPRIGPAPARMADELTPTQEIGLDDIVGSEPASEPA